MHILVLCHILFHIFCGLPCSINKKKRFHWAKIEIKLILGLSATLFPLHTHKTYHCKAYLTKYMGWCNNVTMFERRVSPQHWWSVDMHGTWKCNFRFIFFSYSLPTWNWFLSHCNAFENNISLPHIFASLYVRCIDKTESEYKLQQSTVLIIEDSLHIFYYVSM